MAQALMKKQAMHGLLSALAALFILVSTPAFAGNDVRDVTAVPAGMQQVRYDLDDCRHRVRRCHWVWRHHHRHRVCHWRCRD